MLLPVWAVSQVTTYGVVPPNPDDRAILRREDGRRDYWEGETERSS